MKDALLQILTADVITPLVVALAHSLWQSALVAILLVGVFKKLGTHRPGARYAAALTALGISVVSFLVTFALLQSEPVIPSVSIPSTTSATGLATAETATPAALSTEANRLSSHPLAPMGNPSLRPMACRRHLLPSTHSL